MGAVGGDIKEVTFSHPTIGQGTIFPKANEDSTLDLGGLRSNDDDNAIDSSGEMIDQMNLKRPSFEITAAWDDNVRGDLDKLVKLAASPVPANWQITRVNNSVYGFKGKPVGDLKGNMNAATFPLKVAGSGVAKQIQ